MNFSLNEEQLMLQDSVRKFVLAEYGFENRQKRQRSVPGYALENWNTMAELGWLSLLLQENYGGFNGGARDLAVVMEEMGRGLIVEPFLASAVLCSSLLQRLASEAQKDRWLPQLASGETLMALACWEGSNAFDLRRVSTRAEKCDAGYVLNGTKAVVLNGAEADWLLVSANTERGLSVFLLDARQSGVQVHGYPTVDGGRAAEITFRDVRLPSTALVGAEGMALPGLEYAVDLATLAVCAEALGIMQTLLEKTVEYSKTRQQFGQPIGRFQALQHRMVDMFMECQQARSILLMATTSWDDTVRSEEERRRAVSAAKARIGKAGRLIGQEAVQIHGGIGVTDELDVGHYFKRLTVICQLFGNSDRHLRRFADASW
ncbi:acyl-CoA dehydrogenase family protein [Microbulbifer pacificus]|uniref:acyl-CoA dehydrogenase family protein n=1 Tax=Microbulbifer pacificus TaxID=407164 RepID=UPI000CF42B31|nr:acyl-CoA dehydrogenase family protein [Microbulbifer pacificus]